MKHSLFRALLVGVCGVALLGVTRAPKPKSERQQQMATVMKERINPAMSELSFQIFHPPGGQRDEAKVMEALKALNAEAVSLARAPAKTEEPAFRAGAVLLQASVEGLTAAYQTNESEAEINHWFSHVSAACNGCHSHSKD